MILILQSYSLYYLVSVSVSVVLIEFLTCRGHFHFTLIYIILIIVIMNFYTSIIYNILSSITEHRALSASSASASAYVLCPLSGAVF